MLLCFIASFFYTAHNAASALLFEENHRLSFIPVTFLRDSSLNLSPVLFFTVTLPISSSKRPHTTHPWHWPFYPTCVYYLAEDDNHCNTLWCPECYSTLPPWVYIIRNIKLRETGRSYMNHDITLEQAELYVG
jgi:hypothetical protein